MRISSFFVLLAASIVVVAVSTVLGQAAAPVTPVAQAPVASAAPPAAAPPSAMPPASAGTTPVTPTNSTVASSCVRCDSAATACPACTDGEVCVYVARTCGQCAKKECRPAEAVGASVSDSAVPVETSSNATLFIIIGCCAAGTVIALAAVGLVMRRRRRRRSLQANAGAEPGVSASRTSDVIVDDLDMLDELGEDPLGAHVRVKSMAYGRGLSSNIDNSASVFEPPMRFNMNRRSNASSVISSVGRPEALAVATAPKPRKMVGGQLRIDTSVAACGARSKDSLDRARSATQDLAHISSSIERAPAPLLRDPTLTIDHTMMHQQGASHASMTMMGAGEALLPTITPGMSRFSMASFTTALDIGKGMRPISTAAPPLSPVPAHPPPALPLAVLTAASADNRNDAKRVDDWWRASVNARSTLYDDLGRPISLAYSDMSSNAESAVQVASARKVTGAIQIGSVQQVRASRIMVGQAPEPLAGGANTAQNAYLALTARRSDIPEEGHVEPPTGSIYGVM